MSIPRFAEYAAAFEKAYASEDWSLLEPYFTEDAVYEAELPPPFGGRLEGRAAILDYFRRVVDGFDRRFASRAVALLEGPTERDGTVWLRGRADYTTREAPDLSFELEESATFAGDRIRHLRDTYDDDTRQALLDYVAAHGQRLGLGIEQG